MGYNQKQSTLRLTINFACHCKNIVLFKAFLYSRETFYGYLITNLEGSLQYVDIASFSILFVLFLSWNSTTIRRKFGVLWEIKEYFLFFVYGFCS